MADFSATELSRLSRFSNGRRLFVLKKILQIAIALNVPAVVAAAEWALAHERETRKLERTWRQVRGKRSEARGNAKMIDLQLDRLIGSMLDALKSRLMPLDPNSALALKVRTFIDTYYPEGADAITGAEYEDALAIIEEMNEDFAKLSETDLTELSITYHVQELARLGPLFAAELDRPRNEGFRFQTLRDARLEGHERLCELVSEIISATRGRDTPEKITARARLLAPVFEANERVAQRRKRRNGPDVEVDPNTGEELEPGQDFIDEQDEVVDPNLNGTDDTTS